MRISVPLVFQENVLPKGMQKVRSMSFGEWVDVEIKEVSELDAPIAIQWTPEKYDRTFGDVDGVVTMRYFDGELWSPQIYSASGQPNEHISLERLLEMNQKGYEYANPFIRRSSDASYFVQNPEIYPNFDRDAFRRVDTDNRKEAIETLEQRAARVLIVDGMVWRTTKEPVLIVEPASGHRHDKLFDIKVGIKPSPREDDAMPNFFRLDRMDDAIAFGKERWGDGDYHIKSEPQIFMPEILKNEDDMILIPNELKTFIKRTEDKSILNLPRPQITAWLDLRDAIREISESDLEGTIENAMEKAKILFDEGYDHGWYSNELRGLIYRWDNKPITIAEFKI